MKKVKKTVQALLALALCISTLAACSNASSSPANSKGPAGATGTAGSSGNKKVITVWTNTRSDQDYVMKQIQNYNAKNKDNIEINYQMYTDNYIQTLDMAFATNKGPDIFEDGLNAMIKYVPAGYVEPLNNYLTSDDKTRLGSSAFIDTVNSFSGKIYSIPAYGSTTRLIYNKDIFEKAGISAPPTTVTEMVNDAKIITDKLKGQGIYGYAQNMKSPSSALLRSLDFILMRSGGTRSGYDFKTGKYEFEGYKPLLTAYQQMFTTGIAFPGCESLDIDPLRTQFAAGKIGMYISYTSAEPGVYANQFPTKEKWSVAQLPTIDGEVKGSQELVAGTWYCMNSSSKNKSDAWKVMQFLYSDDFLKGYQEAGLGSIVLPSVKKIASQPKAVVDMPELNLTNNDKIWPNLPLGVTPEGQDMYSVFSNIIFSKAGDVDIDKALKDLDTRYNAAYQKSIAAGKSQKLVDPSFDSNHPDQAKFN